MPEGATNPTLPRVVAVIAIAAAAWFCYSGGKHALASHYALSSNPENWDRATRIEPDNPETWYRLGRYRQLDFDNSNLPLSISDYQRAIKLNPRSPYYKLDLAGAYEMAGDSTAADQNFRAAQAAYPISAEVSWKYGNFLLRQERLTEAYAEIHRAVLVDPNLIPLAVSRVWHSDPDIRLLLDQVLPDTPEAYSGALTFLIGEQNPSAAIEVWRRWIAKNSKPDLKLAYALIDMLVAQEKYEDAGSVWHQALESDPASAAAPGANSLVYDGGFEKDISGGGFGWRQSDAAGADFDYDTEMKHSGERAARVTFDGSKNITYENLFQYVLVSPSTHYRFQGFIRTDKISTESGMRFEIVDPKDPKDVDVLTPNETGSLPWTLEQTDFTTGPKTQMVAIKLVRRESQRLDNRLSGTVWIDDVSLVPGGNGGHDAPRPGSRPAEPK
jgi:tetratricopeptide (TPR) repeat protein